MKRLIRDANRGCTDEKLFKVKNVQEAVDFLREKEANRDFVAEYLKKDTAQAILRYTYHIVKEGEILHPKKKSDIMFGPGYEHGEGTCMFNQTYMVCDIGSNIGQVVKRTRACLTCNSCRRGRFLTCERIGNKDDELRYGIPHYGYLPRNASDQMNIVMTRSRGVSDDLRRLVKHQRVIVRHPDSAENQLATIVNGARCALAGPFAGSTILDVSFHPCKGIVEDMVVFQADPEGKVITVLGGAIVNSLPPTDPDNVIKADEDGNLTVFLRKIQPTDQDDDDQAESSVLTLSGGPLGADEDPSDLTDAERNERAGELMAMANELEAAMWEEEQAAATLALDDPNVFPDHGDDFNVNEAADAAANRIIRADQEIFTVDRLLDVNMCGANGCRMFYVSWCNFGEDANSWEPEWALHDRPHLRADMPDQLWMDALTTLKEDGQQLRPRPKKHCKQCIRVDVDSSLDTVNFVGQFMAESDQHFIAMKDREEAREAQRATREEAATRRLETRAAKVPDNPYARNLNKRVRGCSDLNSLNINDTLALLKATETEQVSLRDPARSYYACIAAHPVFCGDHAIEVEDTVALDLLDYIKAQPTPQPDLEALLQSVADSDRLAPLPPEFAGTRAVDRLVADKYWTVVVVFDVADSVIGSVHVTTPRTAHRSTEGSSGSTTVVVQPDSLQSLVRQLKQLVPSGLSFARRDIAIIRYSNGLYSLAK